MLRYQKDLKLAGIAEFDDRGRDLEFHSFRRTLATMLAKSGVSPAWATKLMRHASIQQWEVYMDEFSLLPQEELEKMPVLKSSPISSLSTGKTCLNVSTDGKVVPINEEPQTLEKQAFGVSLSTSGHGWQSEKWRTERDSNPRYHHWYTPLAGERFRPLSHRSLIDVSAGDEMIFRGFS